MPAPSSTSSSEPTIRWPVELARLVRHLIGVGLVFLVIGEAWFRLPTTTKLVIWEFDDECGFRLAASQSRGLGLGNFSSISPEISINEDRFRNGPIVWKAPTILALGSSETLGTGVKDDEVWTAKCSEMLSRSLGRDVTVVNAGSPGYGPFHQSVVFRRFLERHPKPELVVVRASVGDRNFKEPTAKELAETRNQNDLSRQIKEYSEFLPFLVNRMQAQLAAIRSTFRLSNRAHASAPSGDAERVVESTWRQNAPHWENIAAQASRADVPVLFVVDGADGSRYGELLEELLRAKFSENRMVSIQLFGPGDVGLDSTPASARSAEYARQFTLGFDPHSNAALHLRLAKTLAPVIKTLIHQRQSLH